MVQHGSNQLAETIVWQENFDDGLGDNRWFSDGTQAWQMGTPTVGPQTNAVGGRAYSGTRCAKTGPLNGEYLDNQDSRLIRIASFTVPGTNEHPRLRFWQWFNIQYWYDYGFVEIKPVGSNTWTQISTNYHTYCGGVWTRTSLDLSQFAGQTVQVAFHFYSDDCCDRGDGWYVDDVALVTGTPVFNNPEGFELGLGDWSATRGTWQVGKPTSGPGAAYTGTNCAATVLGGEYPDLADTQLISPPFIVPPAGASPALRFRNWYRFSDGDQVTLEIKPVISSTWVILDTYSGVQGAPWPNTFYDLSAYATQTIQIAFRLTSDDCCSRDVGFYVDDLNIWSPEAPYILTSPSSRTNVVGTTATFTVGASGAAPLNYQWRFNSNPIPSGTDSRLDLVNVQLNQTGYYDVVVTNSLGTVTSAPARLDVVISLVGTDVGDVTPAGGHSQTNNVYTIWGDGEDIEDTADAFHFAHQSLSGDCQIVARLLSLQGGSAQAEAGLMMRESLASGSRHLFLRANVDKMVDLRRRLATDGFSVETLHPSTNYSWLKLMRLGNTFVGHCSTNGTNWEYVWFTTLDLPSQLEVGLAVTAHSYGLLATGVVDNVSVGNLTPLSGTRPQTIHLGGEPLSAAEWTRIGGFKVLLDGGVGDWFAVKSSTNVAASFGPWPLLGNVTNAYGVTPFLDTQARTNKFRFYRTQRIGP